MIKIKFPWDLLRTVLVLGLNGCIPNIVIVDRPSVIEEESAGAWIEIERELSLLHSRIEPVRDVKAQDGKVEDALSVLPTGADRGADQGATRSADDGMKVTK